MLTPHGRPLRELSPIRSISSRESPESKLRQFRERTAALPAAKLLHSHSSAVV